MPFTATQMARVEAALEAHLPADFACVVCGETDLTVVDQIVRVPLEHDLGEVPALNISYLANIGLVCTRCGFTHLFNMLVLGLEPLIGRQGVE